MVTGDYEDSDHNMKLFIDNTIFQSNTLSGINAQGSALRINDIETYITNCQFLNNSAM